MLRVKTVAERMGDNLVRHHATVPRIGKSAQAVNATHGVEESLHVSMMTILSCLFKAIQNRGGAFRRRPCHAGLMLAVANTRLPGIASAVSVARPDASTVLLLMAPPRTPSALG